MHQLPTNQLLAFPVAGAILEVDEVMSNNIHPKIEVRDLRSGDWLWTHKAVLFSDLPDSAFRVYSALAAFAGNEDQRSWPSMITIAERVRSSKSTVVRAMKLLEQCELVRVDRRDGTSNLYTLLPVKEVRIPKPTKAQSTHHSLVRFFHDTTVRVRKVTPTWSPKETMHLKRVLAMNLMSQTQIEQLMLYFLASPRFKKFGPSMSVFFSAGIFNGLMNAMENDPNFWKELDNYSIRLRGKENAVQVDIPMRNMKDMLAQLSARFKVEVHEETGATN